MTVTVPAHFIFLKIKWTTAKIKRQHDIQLPKQEVEMDTTNIFVV